MAGEQNYAFKDGHVGPAANWKAPSAARQKEVLERAFRGYSGAKFEWILDATKIKAARLYKEDGSLVTIYFALRSVSGGGRPDARPFELRVQSDPAVINELFERNSQGDIALIIGIYCNESAEAIVLWRPLNGSTGSGSASKQIDANVVAKAIVNGVSSCMYPDGEVVYAVIPELLRAYIDCFMPKNKLKQTGHQNVNACESRNLIFFGAPGTGKSYELNKRAVAAFEQKNVRRVTFHPEYTYAQFVGCFKPYSRLVVSNDVSASEIADAPTTIEYRYVPGPFIQTYVDAIKHPDENYLLVVEEINRANPAATFGDIFQLLDRDSVGESEYEIAVPQDLHDYLKVQVGPFLKDSFGNSFGTQRMQNSEYIQATASIKIPANMYIWATMNSADQGVFPMDTAFKRRWDFEYMDINNNESVIDYAWVSLGQTDLEVRWNQVRKGINRLLRNAKINEDKWLGPFFIKESSLADDDTFNRAFKDKVLLYLYEDAAKTKRSAIFEDSSKTYSELCADFDANGLDIFKGFPDIEFKSTVENEEF